LLAAAYLAAGCIFSNDAEDPVIPSGPWIEDYFPSPVIGSNAVWKIVITDAATSASAAGKYTAAITGSEEVDHRTFYTGTTTLAEPFPVFALADNIMHIRVDGTMYGLHGGDFPYGRPPDDALPFFDFSATRDARRDVMDWGSKTDTHYINYYIYSWFEGNETVTVGAGTFENCPCFRLELSLVFTPLVSGETVKVSRTEMHWFGIHASPVKREIRTFSNGILLNTRVDELQSLTTSGE
jgi:hypothetical protein